MLWALSSLSPAYNLVQEMRRSFEKKLCPASIEVSESSDINESLFFPRYTRTQWKMHTNIFPHNILDNRFLQLDTDNLGLYKPLRVQRWAKYGKLA